MIYTFDLTEKVVLITGGYGHLGKAITNSLLYHNAIVIVLGRSAEKFENAFSDNKNLYFVHCDISSTESIKKAFTHVFDQFNRLDVLINNALYSKGQSPENMTDEEWKYGIDGSLNSVFRSIREVIPFMKKQKYGKIINVSSMYGMTAPQFEVYDGFPQFLNPPHYGVAKAGIIQLTKYYASYLGNLGLLVNSVTPGPFPSKNVQKSEKFINDLAKKTCLNRVGKPEDLAGTFVFLSSDASDFITGQNIIVDGGWTAK
ncbi:SDR family oxidoreductase [Flavobacterium sp. CS20]|uniref:SDR family oxidoreductase n=1 Tax=Flavobacterium sp. CS20 TaxID=2775246 RepID=UPI001B3A667C|nr:SDR family oxidoreductase [Flavobacterium sp. CS20]QTY26395.1 SDR family oxidoreductase [Flavobacterium sp. CS20]